MLPFKKPPPRDGFVHGRLVAVRGKIESVLRDFEIVAPHLSEEERTALEAIGKGFEQLLSLMKHEAPLAGLVAMVREAAQLPAGASNDPTKQEATKEPNKQEPEKEPGRDPEPRNIPKRPK